MTLYDWNRPILGRVEVIDATVSEVRPTLSAKEWAEWLEWTQRLDCLPEILLEDLSADRCATGILNLTARELGPLQIPAGSELMLWPAEPLESGEGPLEELVGACRLALSRNLRPTPVIERAGQMHPVRLALALRKFVEAGCLSVMLDDEEGAVSSAGVGHLIRFVVGLSRDYGQALEVTWSARNSEGMALAHALEAVESGASRVRATALGDSLIPLELLLVNLVLEGRRSGPIVALSGYCRWAQHCLGQALPVQYPVFGCDAFRISDERLAEVSHELSTGVPASWFGLAVRLELGPDSGPRLAQRWLRQRLLPSTPAHVKEALALGLADHLPNELEVFEALRG